MPKVSDIIHTDSEWEDFDFNDELQTFTSDLQLETQISVSHHLSSNQQLLVENHASFLARHLDQLPAKYTSLDASRPWIIYWITHSLNLLKSFQDQTLESRIISTLNTLQNDTGGYGGGIGQESHLATTYAAVNSLAIIGSPAALDSIKRDALYKWFMSLKLNDGSFMMCRNGERDVRGCYCVVSIAKMLNLSTPELISGTPQFILECQTYEGGIGALPGVEAHGGYTFCAVAAMEMMGKLDMLDTRKMLRWLVMRQMAHEGGFQGRTNKLVDGCYSFWQGGVFPILAAHLNTCQLMNRSMLERYILNCCQSSNGGLLDKPGKSPDFYHSCYCLSGLSILQHVYFKDERGLFYAKEYINQEKELLRDSSLRATHPLHNISLESVDACIKYFQ